MYSAKATIVALALVAGLACVEAAGGVKGFSQQSAFRAQSVKGPAALRPTFQPQQQQQYTFQQQQAPVFAPQPAPQPAFVQQQTFTAQAPIQQQAVKAGPGPATPVFSAIRVQPAPVQQVQQQVQIQEQEPEPVQQQVQQQEQEVEPGAAAQEGNAALLAPARAAAAAASEEEANPRPEPYAFQYSFNAQDQSTSGSSTREEQQDASGRVTGFYTLKGEDGRDRRVDYVADATGFHATINTNELGTANKDSADADWTATEPSEAQVRAAESATQAARQRALSSPAQNHHQQQHHHEQQQQASAFSQQQANLAFSSSTNSASQQKFSSPRQRVAEAGASQSSQFARASAGKPSAPRANSQSSQQQVQFTAQQLQEPFEQIRQTELIGRARKSRHAPFYLFTV